MVKLTNHVTMIKNTKLPQKRIKLEILILQDVLGTLLPTPGLEFVIRYTPISLLKSNNLQSEDIFLYT